MNDPLARLDPDRFDPMRTKSDDEAVRLGYVWSKEKALYVQGFIEDNCKLYKGRWAGQPMRLFGYQQDFIWRLYGWVHPDTGLRRVREAYWEVGKKNAKSPTIAALGLYHLIADGENAPEIYINAAARFQTKPVYDTVSQMVRQNPEMLDILELRPGTNQVRYPDRNGNIFANSAESGSKDGVESSCTIFDELHAQPNRKLWDVFQGAGKARLQPLILSITTAGEPRPEHPCWVQHCRALAVENGSRIDPRFLGVVHGPREKNPDINDRRVWRMANPAMGAIFSEDDFAAEIEKAKRDGPSALADFKRRQLNMWVKGSNLWLDMGVWNEQPGCRPLERAEPIPGARTDDEIEESGDIWAAGLDMSAGGDLTAYVRVAGNPESGVDVRAWFWIPEATAIQRQQEEGLPYLDYAEMTHNGSSVVFLIPGEVIKESVIRDFIIADAERLNGRLRRVYSDHYHAEDVGEACVAAGVDFQWFNQRPLEFTRPLKTIENMLARRVLAHGDHPLLNYCASNAAILKTSANENRQLDKGRSGGRIDGMVALAEALAGLMDLIGYDGDGGEEARKPGPIESGKIEWFYA
ncbi:terminase large subunit [Paludisphaera sp.]|uniref:terminase large subunit n=1 Tax=Paludisphaera sp. TaxID=2017432 RepID=UPI00301E589E